MRSSGPGPVPLPVVVAQVALALVSALHLLVVVVTVTHQAALRRDVHGDRPGLLDADRVASSATALALAVHIPLLVLTGVLAVVLRSGHPWSLRPATVSQTFGIVFAGLSTPPLHALHPLVTVLTLASAAVIGLLWIPARSRRFFAAHPRSRRRAR